MAPSSDFMINMNYVGVHTSEFEHGKQAANVRRAETDSSGGNGACWQTGLSAAAEAPDSTESPSMPESGSSRATPRLPRSPRTTGADADAGSAR